MTGGDGSYGVVQVAYTDESESTTWGNICDNGIGGNEAATVEAVCGFLGQAYDLNLGSLNIFSYFHLTGQQMGFGTVEAAGIQNQAISAPTGLQLLTNIGCQVFTAMEEKVPQMIANMTM